MSEPKKYYWIKLKTNFFNKDEIDFLLSQKNGCEYIVLYQMLCLLTANNDGEMATKVGEMIVPYNIEKIVRDTKYFDTDTVVVAIELFKKLGLIYQEENKSLKISGFNELVGSESANKEAVKKREYRLRLKQKTSEGDNKVDKKGTKCPTEYRDKRLEYRYKSIDIDNNNNICSILNDFEDEFEDIWKQYPKKQGKSNALKSYTKARKKGITRETIENGLNNYLTYIKIERIKPQYIKNGSTWFNQECWNDDYSINREMTTKDIADYMDFKEFK